MDEYRHRIEALFASHPDSGTFGSLPCARWKMWQNRTCYDTNLVN
jgi:hypothetical protein